MKQSFNEINDWFFNIAVHLGLDTPLSAISDTTHVNRDEETKDDDDFDFYD